MFIQEEELRSVAYSYQLEQIVENDATILQMAIEAATEEVRGYLSSRYDTAAAFAATGADRNPLLVEITKDIALWYIIRLSNVDIIYEPVKERYDRAVQWLDRVARGTITPDLPAATDENGDYIQPLRCGSMPKQQYDY
jgi:phage gp36-like protein